MYIKYIIFCIHNVVLYINNIVLYIYWISLITKINEYVDICKKCSI